MLFNYDKDKIKEEITVEDIYDLLAEWGGEPEYTSFGILSATICHNEPGEGRKKLYYYFNSGLFHCYTACEEPSFDIFELTIKVFGIQHHRQMNLNDAVRYIAAKCGIEGCYLDDQETSNLKDWEILTNYERVQNIDIKNNNITLQEYDSDILNRFNYNVKIGPWIRDGIADSALKQASIGFYAGRDQITIPHFDINGRFVGLRGRTLVEQEGAQFGKYRPLKINQTLYTHPLGFNLYNLNFSKTAISQLKKVIVLEGEKSTLQYKSYFGLENDITVACCGSNLSEYQVQLLLSLGVEEIIIAFDRQFQAIGDKEFQRLKSKLLKLYERYKNYVNISFIFDKYLLTSYKASPLDEGKEKFLELFKNRIIL